MDVTRGVLLIALVILQVVTEPAAPGAQHRAGESAIGKLSQNAHLDTGIHPNNVQKLYPSREVIKEKSGKTHDINVKPKTKKRKRKRRTSDDNLGIPVHLKDERGSSPVNNSKVDNIPSGFVNIQDHIKQSLSGKNKTREHSENNKIVPHVDNVNKPKKDSVAFNTQDNHVVNHINNIDNNKVNSVDNYNNNNDNKVQSNDQQRLNNDNQVKPFNDHDNNNNVHAVPQNSVQNTGDANSGNKVINQPVGNEQVAEVPIKQSFDQNRGDIPVQGNPVHFEQQQPQQQQQQQQAIPQSNDNNREFAQNPINANQEPITKKEDSMRIMWDWSDFLINYEQYVMPEQKVRRAPHATTGEPWPMPQYYTTKKNKVYKINREKFQFRIVKESCDIIEKAVIRYKDVIINDTILDMYDNLQHAQGSSFEDIEVKYEKDMYRRAPYLEAVTIKIRKPCVKLPSDKMDESYDLFVKRKSSYIWANEVWGAIRGLETFSQLVFKGIDDELYIKDTTINDYPRFQHRGILLDSSRHFIFKDVIFDVLEAMSQNKMNVLHWHIVDDQSFPYQSKVYPDLSQKGAYHPSFVYSHEDIAEIIEYARLRGIRVMPEFDTPGHTYSWGLSRPDLLTQCYQGAHPVNGYLGPMDPSKNDTYRFLKTFFNEVMHVFKDQYMHLGGDEVPMTCWSSNPDVLRLLNRLDGKPDQPINLQNNDPYMYSYDIRKVLEYYEKRLTTDLKDLGHKRPNGVRFVMWQEIMNNNVQLPNDTIIQIWQGDMGDVQRAIDMGYNAIYSTCWYLDLIEYGVKWPKYYNCDPVDTSFGYQIDEKKVLGGEACIWAEYVDNENLMTTLWPRASAPAERLWSNKDVKDVEAAGKRLSEHRCRMLSRGLQVGMISGPDYCLRRGRRHDRDGSRNCTGDRCYRDVVQYERINVHVQQRGKPDCNQMISSGGSMFSTVVIVILVLAFFITSLKVSGSKMVQIKICKNKTILLAFIGLLVVYFMCYTSLWIQVMEFKGSFEKRVKSSYPDSKYS